MDLQYFLIGAQAEVKKEEKKERGSCSSRSNSSGNLSNLSGSSAASPNYGDYSPHDDLLMMCEPMESPLLPLGKFFH